MACIAKRRGRYVIDFYDNQGKRRWKTLPNGTKKTEAKKVLRQIEDQLSKGLYLPDKKIPIFEIIAGKWLKHKKPNIRKTTWQMYEMIIRLHFEDFNGMKVNRVSTGKVEEYLSKKRESGMNLSTLRRVTVTLNQIMKYAVRHGYIDYNPVRDAERPRDRGEIEKPKISILNTEHINTFLDSVEDTEYKTLFMLAIMSGARQGELLGLKWNDIDWINSQIHIQRTFNKGEWYKPKSRTSIRKIDFGPSMMSVLRKWKIACPPNDSDLVFPNSVGNPIDQSMMLRKYFFPALKKAGINRIRFHDLRHTYASLLIEQGENIKYIQNQLGHASPVVTLEVYAHLINPTNQEAACRLENTIFKTSGSRMVAEAKKGLAK
jgi:integrase